LQFLPIRRTLAATQNPIAGDESMNPDAQHLQGFLAAFLGIYAFLYLLQAVIFIIPTWFISKKAGLSPWLSMLCLFPLTGLILFYILAFADWKVVPAPSIGAWQSPPFPSQPPYPPQA
jgi:hypothetical protein